jgi:diguanylate cyclase (GGDEF)-like protein
LGKANLELQNEIAERERVERQLSYNALHDAMTGLANRTLFLDRLGQAIEHTKRRAEYVFAVLFIDLDQFKVVNDSLGHLRGDQLLILVAQRLRDCLRSSDTIARFGGDEFEILLDVTGAEKTILTVTDKIQEVIRSPFKIEEHEVHVTASIGVLTSLDGYDHAEDVLRDADLAMYQAKALGKGRSEIFDINMRTQAFLHLAVENELRRALDNRELQLYYQPILSLESNRLVGFEALLRWHHPMRGILLPEEFLSVAEESGLILPISNWVLNETCSQLRQWHEQFPDLKDLTVNVNISGKQLLQPNFIERVAAALETHKLKAEYLKLEINEAALISNYARANEVFTELKNLGVQLQVDNFGKGHSAPRYLHQFPITTIKVDKSFIEGMGKGRGTTDFIRAIVSMSRELGIKIIAEGIETGEQLEELKKLLFDFGQGYLFSKPLDAESAEKILARQEKS